ncbi:MAG: DUF4105 domain-containing protein [bacterium]
MKGNLLLFWWLFYPLLLIGLGTPLAAETLAPQTLLQSATTKKIAQHSYWLRLLHYRSTTPTSKSEIVSQDFFLDPNGAQNPQAELNATLRAFYEPVGENPDQHAQCRFIARFHWLQQQLDFSPAPPLIECPRFQRWAGLSKLDSLSVVFVSAYLDNPASFFGHLLVKINLKEGLFAHPLLSPTLNFGASPDPADNALVYAVKGIFGGYSGRFSDERFYNFQHIYGENELRDLWEYPLKLTEAQQRRVLFHTWELLQDIHFEYYFFLENCAYRMAELVAMAWEEEINLYSPSEFWAIPVDVFFRLQRLQTPDGQSVLGNPILVPSRQRRLQWKTIDLNESQQDWVIRIQRQPEQLNKLEQSGLSPEAQAQVLDALTDLLQYQKAREEMLSESLQNLRQQVLLRRSELPILVKKPQPLTPDPLKGHPPLRTQFGGFQRNDTAQGIEVGIRAAYHDLLDPVHGHLPYAELQALDLKIRFDEARWWIHQLKFFEIQNLSVSPTRLDTVSGVSWRTSGEWQEEALDESQHKVMRLVGGIGQSIALHPDLVGFTFADTILQSRTGSMPETSFQLQPAVGVLWQTGDQWSMLAQSSYRQPLLGESAIGLSTEWEGRWQVNPKWGLRFTWQQQGTVQEAKVLVHHFW